MKKRYFFLPLLGTLCLTSCGSKTYAISDYILEIPYQDDFKILHLSDTHIANKDDQEEQFNFLRRTVNNAGSLNMIIVSGDLFTFADKKTAIRYFDFLESFEIPWTVTLGNHDEQCYFSVDWLTSYLNNLSSNPEKHCVFKDIQDDEVNGNSNFAINLMNGNKIQEQLIFMDSNRYYFGSYWGYDWIKEDQINWYENLIDYTASANGGDVVSSLAFFHIPFEEFLDAWNAIETGEATLICGEKREGVSAPKINSGFWDKLQEKGSTKVVSVGHDHLNDFTVLYKGVYLSYCRNSTDRIYFDEDMLGGKTITIHSDHTYDFEIINTTWEAK